jgi:hypothetical protein
MEKKICGLTGLGVHPLELVEKDLIQVQLAWKGFRKG